VSIQAFPDIPGIRALPIPLVGFGDLLTSNIYVLGTGPVTLIDTGPKYPGALKVLEGLLRDAGFGFPDVERIILTHGHIDHFGLSSRIVKAAGHPVSCHMHRDDIWRASSAYVTEGFWNDEVMKFVHMADMPELAVERMRKRSDLFKRFCDPLDDIIPMEDGDTFAGPGFTLEVIHTPGHSPGSCCLLERDKGVLFTGDHIIRHITPNPIMELRRSLLSDPDYQSLRSYEKSLAKVSELGAVYGFSGHGGYVDDLPILIASYRLHHEKRKRQIRRALSKGSKNIYGLTCELFPDIPEHEIFLAISEVFSHLEVLMNEGRAELAHSGPPALYRAL
jgi:glyoxylase-like metal-dependent hydrolase (beta-lactamase superfamily II)